MKKTLKKAVISILLVLVLIILLGVGLIHFFGDKALKAGIETAGTKVSGAMTTITDWLSRYGFVPRFDSQIPNGAPLPAPGQEGTYGAVDDPPLCPTHQGPMKMSQYPTRDGNDQWFCPQKDGDDYCKERQVV